MAENNSPNYKHYVPGPEETTMGVYYGVDGQELSHRSYESEVDAKVDKTQSLNKKPKRYSKVDLYTPKDYWAAYHRGDFRIIT